MSVNANIQISNEEFFKLIKRLASNGKYFTCTFIKQDDMIRTLCGRTGVGKFVKGTGLSFNPSNYHNIVVWENHKKQYRQIKTDNLISFKQGKIKIERTL